MYLIKIKEDAVTAADVAGRLRHAWQRELGVSQICHEARIKYRRMSRSSHDDTKVCVLYAEEAIYKQQTSSSFCP